MKPAAPAAKVGSKPGQSAFTPSFQKNAVRIGLVLAILVGGWQAVEAIKAKISNFRQQSAVVDLPENFYRYYLPRERGCYRVKLDPNRFSGRVYFPEGVDFALNWERDTPAQIRNRFGRVINITHQEDVDLGVSARNDGFQFKGQGSVTIVIAPRP